MTDCPLAEPLKQLLPQSIIVRHNRRDWHSATFSGCQRVIELLTKADNAAIAHFLATISEHEFDLCGVLVADIGVTEQTVDTNGATRLTVEALLLDEEL
jgi:hypothetical protein